MKSDLLPTPPHEGRALSERRWFRLLGLVPFAILIAVAGCGEAPRSAQDEERLRQREHNLTIEDVAVVITSGTTTMRSVRATRAVFHEDTRFLEASSVTLTLRLPHQTRDATIHASRGEVFLAPDKTGTDPETIQEKAAAALKSFLLTRGPVGFDAMEKLTYLPEDEHPFGDVVLYGPVTGQTSDGGEFETQTVLWSEQRKRLMVPHPFSQRIAFPDGQIMFMSGSGFEADSSLQEWVYYSDNEPLVMTWRSGKKEGRTTKDSPTPASPPPKSTQDSPAP